MLTALRRRGWLLPLVTIAVIGSAYAAASLRHVTYTAEAVGVVLGLKNPPSEADRLAVTYASLIPEDSATMNAVANVTGTTPSSVLKHTAVVNNGVDALLRFRFTAGTPGEAILGARALLDAVAGAHPVSTNVVPGSIGAVVSPDTASSSGGTAKYVVIGGILGLALAVLLMSTWDRADPRVDDTEVLASEVGSPASSLDDLSDSTIRLMVERWQQLAGRQRTRIAVLPVAGRFQLQTSEVVDRLSDAARAQGLAVPVVSKAALDAAGVHMENGTGDTAPGEIELIAGPPPGDKSGGEAVAIRSDLTVLVVARGTPRRQVRATCAMLSKFDVTPGWALLVRDLPSRPKGVPPAATSSDEAERPVAVSMVQ
jgi:hypothetical protein